MGLAWYFRTLPDVLGLLQKVRALAGRVTDGLGKPGTEPNVNHPWLALLVQSGLTPSSYTRALMASAVPYAGPPLPGHKALDSYVPELGFGAGTVGADSKEEKGKKEQNKGAEDMGD